MSGRIKLYIADIEGGTFRFCDQTRSKKVLEKLATSEKATIVIERQPDGKMRVTSGSWVGEKVLFKDQVLEVISSVFVG